MTDKELEKEAIAKYKTGSYPQLHPDHFAFIHGYLAGAEPREKRIEELEKELKNWKDEWQEQVQKAIDEGYARTQQTIQLTKAKEIIKILLQYDRGQFFDNRRIYEKYMYTRGEAEQFLKE